MNIFIDLLTSLSIFLIPLLIGGIYGGALITRVAFGMLSIGVIAGIAGLLSSVTSFALVFSSGLWLGTILGVMRMIMRGEGGMIRERLSAISRKEVFLGIGFGLLSVYAFFWLFKSLTPYPYHVNWDTYEHITLAREALTGNFSFFPSQMSDTFTFNGYTPLFHLLIALPVAMFGASYLGSYYFAEWWFYLAAVLASLWIGYRVYKSRLAAVVMGLLALFAFASTVVYLPLFLIPQNLTALLFALGMFTFSYKSTKDGIALVLIALVLLLMHFVMGGVAVALFVFWHLFQWARSHTAFFARSWIMPGLLTGGSLLLVSSLLLHLSGGIMLTGREEAQYYQFPLRVLFEFFKQWYGWIGVVFVQVGVWMLVRSEKNEHKLLAAMSLALFAVCFSPLSYTLKFFSLGWFFMNLILTAGFVWVLRQFSGRFRLLALGMLAGALLLQYYVNQTQYKMYLYHSGKEAHMSRLEIEAGTFLKEREKEAFIVSDPATQGILEALADGNSQGGVYMGEPARETLSQMGKAKPKQAAILSAQIEDIIPSERAGERYLVLSGRYFAWQRFTKEQKASFFYNIWKPHALSREDKEKIQQYKEAGFKPVYENAEMAIFKL